MYFRPRGPRLDTMWDWAILTSYLLLMVLMRLVAVRLVQRALDKFVARPSTPSSPFTTAKDP